jgi:hypothetical protein
VPDQPVHRIAAGLRIGKSRTVSVGRLAVTGRVSWLYDGGFHPHRGESTMVRDGRNGGCR